MASKCEINHSCTDNAVVVNSGEIIFGGGQVDNILVDQNQGIGKMKGYVKMPYTGKIMQASGWNQDLMNYKVREVISEGVTLQKDLLSKFPQLTVDIIGRFHHPQLALQHFMCLTTLIPMSKAATAAMETVKIIASCFFTSNLRLQYGLLFMNQEVVEEDSASSPNKEVVEEDSEISISDKINATNQTPSNSESSIPKEKFAPKPYRHKYLLSSWKVTLLRPLFKDHISALETMSSFGKMPIFLLTFASIGDWAHMFMAPPTLNMRAVKICNRVLSYWTMEANLPKVYATMAFGTSIATFTSHLLPL